MRPEARLQERYHPLQACRHCCPSRQRKARAVGRPAVCVICARSVVASSLELHLPRRATTSSTQQRAQVQRLVANARLLECVLQAPLAGRWTCRWMRWCGGQCQTARHSELNAPRLGLAPARRR